MPLSTWGALGWLIYFHCSFDSFHTFLEIFYESVRKSLHSINSLNFPSKSQSFDGSGSQTREFADL